MKQLETHEQFIKDLLLKGVAIPYFSGMTVTVKSVGKEYSPEL